MFPRICLLLFWAWPLMFCRAEENPSAPPNILFSSDFEFAQPPASWTGGGDGSILWRDGLLEVENKTRGNHLLSIPLPVEKLRGLRATLSAGIGAENVSKPAEPWNGVKLMLYTKSPKGPDYQGAMDLFGSFAAKETGLSVFIPPDATEASIILGLQDVAGKAWFDDVQLRISALPRKKPVERLALPLPEKLDRRTEIPRLRGVMYGPKGKKEDLEVLASWKANLIRWQFYWYDGSFPEKRLDLALYDKWLEETITGLDELLPLCEKLGLKVVIDLHTPPGGGGSGTWALFEDVRYQEKFLQVWERLARHYKDQPAVWAYDLVNEPVEGRVGEGLRDWRALAEDTAKRVRAIDPKKAIIIEPGPSGGWGNLPYFEPLPLPGIIYSVHVYDPIEFTHQGILGGMPEGVSYPGVVRGVMWNKEKLKEALAPVREYQMDYRVPIYIGEFSAPRWAPDGSAGRYLRDCIEIFEEYGWDWSYHAFREWQGWNVELDDGKEERISAVPSERKRVLLEGFLKNVGR